MSGQDMLAKELDLSVDELDKMELSCLNLEGDFGSHCGDMSYAFYFYVPECTPDSILKKKAWSIGDYIEVPIWTFGKLTDLIYQISGRLF